MNFNTEISLPTRETRLARGPNLEVLLYSIQ